MDNEPLDLEEINARERELKKFLIGYNYDRVDDRAHGEMRVLFRGRTSWMSSVVAQRGSTISDLIAEVERLRKLKTKMEDEIHDLALEWIAAR